MKNIILIDWLSFTCKSHSITSIISFLGLDDIKFIEMNGMYGYQDRLYFDGINIHYNNKRFPGVWVEMSGKGCRCFDEYSSVDWDFVFSCFREEISDFNVTRLDVAYDDKIGMLNLNTIYRETLSQNYVSKFTSYECVQSNKGITVYLGSKKSLVMLRFYDKAAERNREADGHWVRCELQLRDSRAFEFINQLSSKDIGVLFSGVINNYIRYVKPNKKDSHKHRWNTRKWWSDFIDGAGKISLLTNCDTEYNLIRCEDYVYLQAGGAIDCLIEIKGVDKFISELKERKSVSNKKYIALKQKFASDSGDKIAAFLKERNF